MDRLPGALSLTPPAWPVRLLTPGVHDLADSADPTDDGSDRPVLHRRPVSNRGRVSRAVYFVPHRGAAVKTEDVNRKAQPVRLSHTLWFFFSVPGSAWDCKGRAALPLYQRLRAGRAWVRGVGNR